jgi:hypothetical protein
VFYFLRDVADIADVADTVFYIFGVCFRQRMIQLWQVV